MSFLMQRLSYRFALLLLVILFTTSAFAANNNPRNINDNDTVTLHGNVHPNARPEFDRGPADQNLAYEKMVMVLSPRQDAKDNINALLAQQHDPASPLYHQWLTPAEFGKRFGIADDDLKAITDWLGRKGFTIDEIATGRGTINFTGSVGAVERAFHVNIHNYEVDGKLYHANSNDPQIPRALSDIVSGIATLHNFPKKAMNLGVNKVSPDWTSSTGNHYVSPADFAKIYNVNPLYTAGINGTGQTIAIVGRTDIKLADVQYFRSYFGLPANDPIFINNGADPGDVGGGEEGEADLDVEWAGAVAKNATIKFVITKSTSTTDGVDLSAQYIVNNNVAKIMSTSFGQCESSMGTSENTFYNNLWSQAATQGITSFVSSGDSGAAGCNVGKDTTGSGAAVSGLASTPYNIAVGGSQFNDTASPSTYWNSTNGSDQSSALGYIPEIAWNESANVSGGTGLWASSGGQSTVYSKPSWQVCVGVPSTNARFVPDIALTAASHDGYLVIQGHTSTVSGLGAVGGTSASSPSFASLMALVNQKTGQSWGNANTKFYALANAQYASSGTVMFHDVTSGNNSVPGVTGFSCSVGYDAVTGVGTVDANALVNNFSGATTYSISGNAGTSGASVSVGSVSATSDSSSNYTIGSLAAGTYTVTPSKSGCTFSPASSSVTITSANVTGVNFTATCGTINTLFSDGFEAAGWSTAQVSGTAGAFTIVTASSYPSISAHGGTHWADFNSYTSAAGSQTRLYRSSGFAIPSTYSSVTMTFWVYHDPGYSTDADRVQAQVSTNGGSTWTNVGTAVNRYSATTGWAQATVDLTAYKGQTVQLGFLGISAYGNDVYVDDVLVTASGVSSTYSISGNAGTTGANVSVGSSFATSDSSSNYTISNLGAGTYTVTPSKSGCTFSPASSSVTITSSNVTGVNFTATCTAPTFSISGNAGTTGANVSVGSTFATSDSSSNYTISNLAAGSYTVTPSKSGCTFSPVSSSVTITTSSVSGVNFTATCGTTTLFNDGFEVGGWSTAQVSGTAGAWSLVTTSSYPSITAHGGTHWADFNSYTSSSGSQTRLYRSTGFAVSSSFTTVTLKFWMYHDTGYSTYADKVQAQVSTNGTTWTNVGTAVARYGTAGWTQVSIDISAYKGQTVYLGFVGISAYGNDEYLDDVTVTAQ